MVWVRRFCCIDASLRCSTITCRTSRARRGYTLRLPDILRNSFSMPKRSALDSFPQYYTCVHTEPWRICEDDEKRMRPRSMAPRVPELSPKSKVGTFGKERGGFPRVEVPILRGGRFRKCGWPMVINARAGSRPEKAEVCAPSAVIPCHAFPQCIYYSMCGDDHETEILLSASLQPPHACERCYQLCEMRNGRMELCSVSCRE
jgi:hypothetical protein